MDCSGGLGQIGGDMDMPKFPVGEPGENSRLLVERRMIVFQKVSCVQIKTWPTIPKLEGALKHLQRWTAVGQKDWCVPTHAKIFLN